jgi:gas vesicle protein
MDDDRSVVVLGAVVGAALGGLAGYLFLTERGRQLRHDVGLRLDAFAHDVATFQATIATVHAAMDDGLRIVSSVAEHRRT